VAAQPARRRHYPAHCQRRADFFDLAAAVRPRANHFLQRDDVSFEIAEHCSDPLRAAASIQSDAAMDVVGDDAQRPLAGLAHSAYDSP
jgi:hypothetical protein